MCEILDIYRFIMNNTPKILSNELDQVPKTWERYEKEINNPEVHNQIVDAFDEYEKKCPFPNHVWYSQVWEKLIPQERKRMRENIRIANDGKIEIIKMKKKFSLLTAEPNHNDLLSWDYVDKNWNTGIKWLAFFDFFSVKKECEKQNKKILESDTPINLIDFFPWKNTEEKIHNLAILFNLKTTWYLNNITNEWVWVDNWGSVSYWIANNYRGNSWPVLYRFSWWFSSRGYGLAGDVPVYHKYGQWWWLVSSPFIVYEDC